MKQETGVTVGTEVAFNLITLSQHTGLCIINVRLLCFLVRNEQKPLLYSERRNLFYEDLCGLWAVKWQKCSACRQKEPPVAARIPILKWPRVLNRSLYHFVAFLCERRSVHRENLMSGTIHPEIFNICGRVAFVIKRESHASQWKTWLAKASFVHSPLPSKLPESGS